MRSLGPKKSDASRAAAASSCEPRVESAAAPATD